MPPVASHPTNSSTPIPPLVGRPRTRPLSKAGGSAGSGGQKSALHQDKSNLSSEELNQSIEFILDESEGFEEVAGAAAPGPSGSGGAFLPKVIKPGGVLSKQLPPVNLAAGTKIKMIPSSQFVQIKSLAPQSKLINYALNKPGTGTTTSTTNIGSIVKTLPGSSSSGGQQIFTLKTPTGQTTQFTTAAASGSSTSSSPGGTQKYTVFKNANGMTMLQLSKPASATGGSPSSANVDLSNIIDMPIVFADNEGNIAEQQQQQQQVDKDPKPGRFHLAKFSIGRFLNDYFLASSQLPLEAPQRPRLSSVRRSSRRPTNPQALSPAAAPQQPQSRAEATSCSTRACISYLPPPRRPVAQQWRARIRLSTLTATQ